MLPLLLLLCGSYMTGANAAVDKSKAIESIVAVVNEEVITRLELDRELQMLKRQFRAQRRPLPPDSMLEKQVLERAVVMRLQLQLADRRLIRVDDEQLNRTIENMARQNGLTLSRFRSAIEAEGMRFADYRQRIRDELIISKLQQRVVASRIDVTDKEVADLLANQAVQGGQNREYHIFHILKAVPEAANAATIQQIKGQAQGMLAQLRLGSDFSQLAVTQSDGQQALEGGDLGWRKPEQMPGLFAQLIPQMKPGEVSELIRSASGFHIVKLQDVRDADEKHLIQQSKTRHILIRVSEDQNQELAFEKIKTLQKRLSRGETFADLAKEQSDDTVSAQQGGDLGWVNRGQMVKEFEQVMLSLAPGQISEPVRTQFGWHLILVEERRDYDNTDNFRKNRAADMIRQRKLEPALANWIRQLRDESYVDIRL